MPMLGPDLQELSIQVERITPDILHCKIGAAGRWEVPKSVFNAPNVTGAAAAPCASTKQGAGTLLTCPGAALCAALRADGSLWSQHAIAMPASVMNCISHYVMAYASRMAGLASLTITIRSFHSAVLSFLFALH